jgi:hypothetical protein
MLENAHKGWRQRRKKKEEERRKGGDRGKLNVVVSCYG